MDNIVAVYLLIPRGVKVLANRAGSFAGETPWKSRIASGFALDRESKVSCSITREDRYQAVFVTAVTRNDVRMVAAQERMGLSNK